MYDNFDSCEENDYCTWIDGDGAGSCIYDDEDDLPECLEDCPGIDDVEGDFEDGDGQIFCEWFVITDITTCAADCYIDDPDTGCILDAIAPICEECLNDSSCADTSYWPDSMFEDCDTSDDGGDDGMDDGGEWNCNTETEQSSCESYDNCVWHYDEENEQGYCMEDYDGCGMFEDEESCNYGGCTWTFDYYSNDYI
jgi:hypothetical protein